MSLIDRYIAEVGRNLPEKNRADIEAEIRSTLEDMVEERRRHVTKSTDDKIIVETLEQLGDPKLLASKYTPLKRYLIGPGWYDVYLKTLQRVLFTALPVFAVVTFILTLTENPLDFINAVGEAVGGAFSVGLQILFWVTIVFVLLERSDEIPNIPQSAETRAWSVAQLPKLPIKRQISIVETVINIAFILFVLIWIALPITLDRLQGNPAPVVFHPNLWNIWLPLFFVIMGLTLVHEVFRLKIGNWTPALMVTNVILGLTSIAYIIVLVTTQEVFNPAFLATLNDGVALAELRNVTVWATWSINITAAVIIGVYVWDIVDSVRKAKLLGKQKDTMAGSMTRMLV